MNTIAKSCRPQQLEPGLEKPYSTIEAEKNESYANVAVSQFKKSRVKQIATMYDTKVSQNVVAETYKSRCGIVKPDDVQLQTNHSLTTSRHSNKSNFFKNQAPISKPRTKFEFKAQDTGGAPSLVKQRVQLYDRLDSQVSHKKPKLVKPAELLAASVGKAEEKGAVIYEKQASVRDLLAKLEARQKAPREEINSKPSRAMDLEDASKRHTFFKSAEPKATPRKNRTAASVRVSESTVSKTETSPNRLSKGKKDFALNFLTKTTSKEPPADSPEVQSHMVSELTKPARFTRKKKLRHFPAEPNDQEIFWSAATNQVAEKQFLARASDGELDGDLMRRVNSPTKVKAAYTLTGWSTSPWQEKEDSITCLNKQTDQTWSTPADNFAYQEEQGPSNNAYLRGEALPTSSPNFSSQENSDERKHLKEEALPTSPNATNNSSSPENAKEMKHFKRHTSTIEISTELPLSSLSEEVSSSDATAASVFDSFNDLGFETGSNDVESSTRSPMSVAFNEPDAEQANSVIFLWTPEAKDREEVYRPMAVPPKNHQKSVYNSEPRRSSGAMQPKQPKIPSSLNNAKEKKFSARTASSLDPSFTRQTSQYWIKCGYFSLAFNIFFKSAEQVLSLYDIFNQKSCQSRDLSFGIDNLKFSPSHAYETKENLSKNLPLQNDCSHYWFSKGDVIVSFAGRRVSPHKIQHVFQFVKRSLQESDFMRFGVDEVEFSVPISDFRNESSRFTMDSNYSLLVGLHSGNSNGLEGRSKYAWPCTRPDNLEKRNSGRFSLSGL